jgi:hypothetical protein
MLGDLSTHQLHPPGEHHTRRHVVGPATIGDQPGRQPTQRLRVPVIGPGTGPPATSPRRRGLVR